MNTDIIHRINTLLLRACAAILLAAYITGLNSAIGKLLVILSVCGIFIVIGTAIILIVNKKWLISTLQEEQDPVFWPAILLLWLVEVQDKGGSAKGIIVLLVLFCLVIIAEIAIKIIKNH